MRIVSTKDDAVSRIKMLIYGKPGAGKTTLAGTIDDLSSVVVVSAESGQLVLRKKAIDIIDITLDDKGELIPEQKRLARLQEVYQWLMTSEARAKYKWVFIDSLTEIAQNCVKMLDSDPKWMPEKMAIAKWGEYTKEMKAFIKAYRDMPHYNVVFTALAEDDKDEMGMLVTGVMMPGKISQQIPAWFDEVYYLGTSKNTDGTEVRRLLTSQTERIPYTKNRGGNLDKFEEPNLQTVINKIKGDK